MIKIENNSNLDYETIGNCIDKYLSSDDDCTLYNGKIDFFAFLHNKRVYRVEVLYQKSGLKFFVKEVKENG